MNERMNSVEVFDGIRFPGFMHTQESLRAACGFQFQDTDILLVTFPKSGTTWMQQVLSLIFCEGCLWPIHHLPNWARAPWMEQISFSHLLTQLNTSWPRLLTTHLPAKALAPALRKSKARVIYVARNPKDVLVSFYHFHKIAGFLPDPSSFEDFVDEFLKGTGFFGSWFDHVKGWLGLQQDLNLLLVTYEELHQVRTPCTQPLDFLNEIPALPEHSVKHAFLGQEPRATIRKLGEFLGHPLGPEEEAVILKHCTFSFMSQSSMVNYSLLSKDIMDQSRGKFLRKGTSRPPSLRSDQPLLAGPILGPSAFMLLYPTAAPKPAPQLSLHSPLRPSLVPAARGLPQRIVPQSKTTRAYENTVQACDTVLWWLPS